MLGYGREQIVEQVQGQYAETLFSGRWFWRDRYKHEVDVVLEDPEGLIPIEIKYRNRIGTPGMKNLLLFMEEYGIRSGIMITKDRFEKTMAGDREIWYIPAWLALLAQDPGIPGPRNE